MIVRPTRWERQQYWQGQQLRSHDLNDQLLKADQLRWWHTRALHNAYGVAYGLETSESDGGVTIQSGLAYDIYGREMQLGTETHFKFPSRDRDNDSWTLVLSYADAAIDIGPSETKHVSRTNLVLCWRRRQLSWRHGVALAQTTGQSLNSEFAPMRVRPLSRPRIGQGTTPPNATAWQSWKLDMRFMGLEVRIDTSAVGFSDVPCYFAWLTGSLWQPENESDNKNLSLEQLKAMTGSFGHIHAPMPDSFTYRIWLPWANGHLEERFLLTRAQTQLTVCWLGIQQEKSAISESEVEHGFI